ncbi:MULTISPECIES: ABC transporter ATP-binding protein [Gardnerella]|uniref:ABC transporter ATP-binding protein n=1 Tax=Gardnerella leopoldii TaxID=2792978 RepID=A0ABX4SIE6_9BIFI|nr:ABC transporter, nucleotide binding/ATPase protein (peptide) [Gardnerella vaginalis AMD]NSX52946.1 ABC transporter ATP-binding protein [Gardnerella vaginalis]PKZ18581.1 ABC transporter ATP-binding protein [Gardnerella vaginalis]PKZ19732.1 ABC transporter ATP-binding protein [Gardnerella vaginalis]RFT30240.1 ABC transporter ATP-binding protein [Bifidobacteriaceae bacterium VN003]
MSLNIQNLTLKLGGKLILDNVSIEISDGERVGLVGSSGSGKSMLIRAITGLLPSNAEISGSCMLGNFQTVKAKDENLASIRGKYVGVVFQQANRALNPMLSVEKQISLPLRIHYNLDDDDIHNRVCMMLEKVGLSKNLASKRTFELSGGQQQRVGIATALITSPRLILADEPTTALDSVTQSEVVRMLASLVDDMGASMLFVTHDFSVLSHAANRCYVLDSGRVVDSENIKNLLDNPRISSTKQLVSAAKKLTFRAQNLGSKNLDSVKVGSANVDFANTGSANVDSKKFNSRIGNSEENSLINAKNIHVILGRAKTRAEVLRGVDLNLNIGESLAIIGGSGSGKTTLIRAMLGLETLSEGNVTYCGEIVNNANLLEVNKNACTLMRRESSLVFQHPFAALDPRWTVQKSVAEPLRIWQKSLKLDDATIEQRVCEMLKLVGLKPEDFLERHPHELSGGQAQCVCIARALINNPRVLLADEPMSAIDVAERTRILDAFASIRSERKSMSCIFVSHDLGMIRHLATRVIVLNEGKVVECGSVNDVLNNPQNDYTRALVNAAIM